MKYWYLAAPYSHPSREMRRQRFLACLEACALLFNGGEYVYSPIVHCHPLQETYAMPVGWKFWAGYDRCMIEASQGVHLLLLPGWRESIGVQMELEIVRELNLTLRETTLEQLRYAKKKA